MGLFSRKVKVQEPAYSNVPNPYGWGSVNVDPLGNIVGQVRFGSYLDDRDAETEVVGESFCREALLDIITNATPGDIKGPGRVESVFELKREPDNQHDPNAVAVTTWGGAERVGYLPRELAAEMAPTLDLLEEGGADQFTCVGLVLWPAKKGDPFTDADIPVGVRLDLVVKGRDQWWSPESRV